MDEMIIHLAAEPRRHPATLPVAHLGWLPAKRNRIRHAFRSWNYSFILAGTGTYRSGSSLQNVRAPCVLTQTPGQACDYGPERTWDEMFLIYRADAGPRLAAMGFHDPARPLWHVGPNRLTPLLLELRELVRCVPLAAAVDRIDRTCERLLLESLLSASAEDAGGDAAIARIRAQVDADGVAEHDFAALARGEGLSYPHFRRRWLAAVGSPPERYRTGLRMAQACRLLVEGEAPIAQIARATGFTDPLHFSRRFRACQGISPGAYRTQARNELSRS
jgi:AraC-like DNA-binding protein